MGFNSAFKGLNPCQDGTNKPMGLGITLQNNDTSVQKTKHI